MKKEELKLISRKAFIANATQAVGGLLLLNALPNVVKGKAQPKPLTILHTNDWHSRIEPFAANSGSYAGMGGAAVRAAYIKKVRAENPNVLLLDAGDVFQGTPYFNLFGGELEFKLMSQMGYDAITLGNHDFDNGIEGLYKNLPYAAFSVLNCNYNFGKTKLASQVKPYKVFNKGGIKVGVTGVGIDLNGLVPNENFEGIACQNPVEILNATATFLKQQKKCDLVVCLSHLGYEYASDKIDDKKLAKLSKNVDVILGGHTHTFLPEPVTIQNAENKPVIVNQVGWAGLQIGRLDFSFHPFESLVNKAFSENVYIQPNLV